MAKNINEVLKLIEQLRDYSCKRFPDPEDDDGAIIWNYLLQMEELLTQE